MKLGEIIDELTRLTHKVTNRATLPVYAKFSMEAPYANEDTEWILNVERISVQTDRVILELDFLKLRNSKPMKLHPMRK